MPRRGHQAPGEVRDGVAPEQARRRGDRAVGIREDLSKLGADELLTLGRRAHRAADADGLRACLRELEVRSSRKAAAAQDELRELLVQILPRPKLTAVREAQGPVDGARVLVLKDAEILRYRLQMIERADKSVWLSSLTFPSADLVDALERQARGERDVRMIIADRTVCNTHAAALRRLDKAGVQYKLLDSTHSKLLIVDGAHVMVGSANASHVHRDVCVVFRDRAKAKELTEYMDDLE